MNTSVSVFIELLFNYQLNKLNVTAGSLIYMFCAATTTDGQPHLHSFILKLLIEYIQCGLCPEAQVRWKPEALRTSGHVILTDVTGSKL